MKPNLQFSQKQILLDYVMILLFIIPAFLADNRLSAQCSGLGSITFNVSAAPQPTLTFNNQICLGQSTTISVDQVYNSYAWSTGAGGQSISVNTGDTYTVTVTNAGGCSATATATVVASGLSFGLTTTSLPCQLSINGPVGGIASYVWSSGQTGVSTIQVNVSDTYTLTVTDNSGCTATSTLMVTIPPPPVVSITGNSGLCPGSNSQLTATPGFDTYQWSAGGSSTNINTISAAGTYTVTVSNSIGCTSTNSVVITSSTPPSPAATPVAAVCAGQSVNLSLANGPFSAYSWSTGSVGPTISVSVPGTYTVTVTDVQGCTGTSSVPVTINPLPNPSISTLPYACNGSYTLQASGSFPNYVWSNAANTSGITVNSIGAYTVTVTDLNGCTGPNTFNIVSFPAAPIVSINGATSFCSNQTTTLSATAGFTAYTWSGGLGSGQQVSVAAAGTYTVTATDALGCTTTESIVVNTNPAPVPVLNPLSAICAGQASVISLVNGPFNVYAWSNLSSSTSITVNTPGAYTVTVTNALGCTGTASVNLVVNNSPILSIAQAPYNCAGTITLQATAGLSGYIWSNGISGASINVSSSGTYSVTATGSNGCSSTFFVSTVIPSPPVVTVTGASQICQNQSATLAASPGFAIYAWSNGLSTSSISVSQNGTYFVTATDGFGCTAMSSASVSVFTQPIFQINGPTSICAGNNAIYTTTGAFPSYAWSNGSSTNSISVTASGTYSVTVTDLNGCSATDMVNLTVGNSITVSINEQPYTCNGQITLEVGSGFQTYSWSTGASSPTLTVSDIGTYSVTVTSASGCSGSADIFVNIPAPPSVSISGQPQFCQGSSTVITANPGFQNYLWNNGTLNAALTISTLGTYTITVTDQDGCTATESQFVTELFSPQPAITGPTSICPNSMATLGLASTTGLSNISWSTGQASPSIVVGIGGNYGVTVTSTNGCIGSDELLLSVNGSLQPTITQQTYSCDNQIILDAGSGFQTYAWSNGVSLQTNVISASASYSLTVTDVTGCSGTSSINLTIPDPPNVAISGVTLFCVGETTTLTATPGYQNYQWSNGGGNTNTSVISTSGTYTVTIVDTYGCTASANQVVTGGTPITVQITGGTSLCNGSSTTLSANKIFSSYLWSDGQTSSQITTNSPGVIGLTVTDASGCTATTSATINLSNSLSPQIVEQPYDCNGQIVLDAGLGFLSYTWSNGPTTQTNAVNANNTYIVTVTDLSGCTGTAQLSVVIPVNPIVSIAGGGTICAGASAYLKPMRDFKAIFGQITLAFGKLLSPHQAYIPSLPPMLTVAPPPVIQLFLQLILFRCKLPAVRVFAMDSQHNYQQIMYFKATHGQQEKAAKASL